MSRSFAQAARGRMLFATALLCIPGIAAQAADASWPSRPIRVVVPFAPGNAGDVTFRIVQKELEARLGANFYIDNKSGASGNIGAEDVVRSAPDGYTLLLGATNNFVTNQYLATLRYDPIKDLVPISVINNAPAVVVVNANLPANSLDELTAYAKQHPGKLNYGTPGSGTAPHLVGALYAQAAGVDIVHVPYRGAPPAVQALVAGDVQIFFAAAGISTVAGHIASGRLKALAVASPRRLPALPEVKTTAEQGMPALVAGNWWGLAAPVGTDPAIVQKLADAVKAAVSKPEIVQQFEKLGVTPVGNSPEEFGAQITREAATWKATIEKAGIRAE
ncbi:tripartite tricarboxylate transporter substrate binding protein [Pigmentiphaga sp.]|uniref:Bug family tripartite tricarboxylate transporter substrate binding protein n=1 Tax=Pigmentiphaga sp. TaxID=1977564 RepID=UPI0025F88B3D|nr:tripartite tricarboxylate transporter substrate binding protein [Pigmentiphaga sp.]MBX6320002.1 tripartite tricarboxylate transporter substrate binding protein [Pigmentiphaga sp.]